MELVSRFVALLREWTLEGPGLINCDREDAGQHQSVELRRLFFELLTKRDELPLLHALSRQWVRGSNDDGEHLDEFIFLLKHLPRAFSRTDRYTGMLNITGAEGSGKGTFIFLLKCFGGETDDNLGHSLGRNYLYECNKKARGSEECSPVLAGARNKAFLYCEDCPPEELNIDRLKPLVEHRGGAITARWGGARKKDNATHEPTYTCLTQSTKKVILPIIIRLFKDSVFLNMFLNGNSEIRIPEKAVGIRGKINELCPPNRFVNRGEASEAHHVEYCPEFSTHLKNGDFDAEIFMYIRVFSH